MLLGFGEPYLFSLFSNIVFFFLMISFLKDLKKHPPLHREYFKYRKNSVFLAFLRYFIFILILTNFVFIASIAIHEFGHFTVAKFYNCEYNKIVYDDSFPHTETLCKDLENNSLVVLGGVLLPFFISGILFIIGGKFIRDISLLITGFNLIASNRDLLEMGFSDNLIMAAVVLGIILLIAGISMLARSRTEEWGLLP